MEAGHTQYLASFAIHLSASRIGLFQRTVAPALSGDRWLTLDEESLFLAVRRR